MSQPLMRFFEDVQPGEILRSAAQVVDPAQAASFAELYDPAFVPASGITYVHRGPAISPWLVAALGWKALCDLAASSGIAEAAFSKQSDLHWHTRVCASDRLRVEAEVLEPLSPFATTPHHGFFKTKVTLITTGAAGFGSWGDNDGELVDDTALTYLALLKARRARSLSIHEDL